MAAQSHLGEQSTALHGTSLSLFSLSSGPFVCIATRRFRERATAVLFPLTREEGVGGRGEQVYFTAFQRLIKGVGRGAGKTISFLHPVAQIQTFSSWSAKGRPSVARGRLDK